MKLRPSVKEAKKQLHIEKLKRKQVKPINTILDGQDTLVIAPTSYGKSLLYQIPAIIRQDAMTIVLEPLLALIHDQVEKLQMLGIPATYLDSTQSKSAQASVMESLHNGEIQILYLTPERLESNILSRIEKNNEIGMIVVDECHCVVSWGYTFRASYLMIGEYIDRLKRHPVVVALSATAPPEDRPQIMELLSMRKAETFELSLYRSNLSFIKRIVSSRKAQKKELEKCFKEFHKHTTIVFCNTKAAVENVAQCLETLYPGEVTAYHSGKKKQEKEMLSGKKHIIVATSALSMGVDVRDVDLVVHFNMPLSLTDYYQMAGRAGREGQKARSILMYNPDDYYTNCVLINDIEDLDEKAAAQNRLDEMKEFCEDTKHCMVQTVLQALGDLSTGKCRYCTNCQKER